MSWLSGWNKRIKMVTSSFWVDEDLTDFPVMVQLTSNTGRTNTDVTDIFDILTQPVGTYAILNSADKSASVTLTNGDLTAEVLPNSWHSVRSTVSQYSGKWYWEVTVDFPAVRTDIMIGIGNSSAPLTNYPGADVDGYSYYSWNGQKYNSSTVSYGDQFLAGDIIGVALDLDSGKIWWSKNGTWQGSGDPSAGTGEAYNGVVGIIYAMIGIHGNTNPKVTVNFGASAFSYTVPTGFNPGFYDAVTNNKKIAVTTMVSGVETELYTEIERWDIYSEEAYLWTKVPVISGSEDITLYLYYDSTQSDNTFYIGDTGDLAATNVWNSNFAGVWHMAQDPSGAGSPMKDSTGNSDRSTSGSMTNSDLINGLVGKAIDFDGSDDYVDIQSDVFDGLSSVTVSVIVNLDTYAASGQSPILVDRTGGTNDFQFIVMPDDNTPHKIQFSVWASVDGTARTSSDMPLNTWTHLTGRYISGDINVFVNGADNSFITGTVPTGGITSVSSVNRLAGDAYGNHLDGKICEFRMATIGLSDAWIKADYYNTIDNFITYTIEALPQHYFSGVTQLESIPAGSRTLYLYRRDTGEYMGTTTSSGDGTFSMTTTYSGTHFVVAIDDDGGADYNEVVVGNIIPLPL